MERRSGLHHIQCVEHRGKPVIRHWIILGIGVATLLAAAAAAFHFYLNSSGRPSNEAHDPVFTVAIAENYREVDLNGIDCLSTIKDRAMIFEHDYSDHKD